MKRRAIWIAAAAVIVIAAVAGGWWWRVTPPRAIRLLPEADGYAYINVAALRAAGATDKAPELIDAPEYQDFLKSAQIVPSRDVDQIAIARLGELEGRVPGRHIYVVTGRFRSERAYPWLDAHAKDKKSYRNHAVYLVAVESRDVQVCFLNDHIIAVTNGADEARMDQVIDRFLQSFPARPDALAGYYADVPVGSVVWGIGRFAAQPPPRGNSLINSALRKLMAGTMLVGSARYVPSTNGGTLEWRTKACAATEEQARQIAEQLGTSLRLYYSITLELGKQGHNPDLDAAINSLRVEQQGKCAILSADVPARLMQKLAQNNEQ